jgi:hypothetical protein
MTQENEQGTMGLAVQENQGGELTQHDTFDMTVEQAEKQIEKSLQMYALAGKVINKLLDEKKDMYYMGELSGGKKKDDELPVINKQGVDKLISFFKIETIPKVEQIDGGYKVTVTGNTQHGKYITSGTGICTRYEKKYAWIKADEEEYKEASEENRRKKTGKSRYGKGTYEILQIKTDERSLAHTLISMAEKRARAALLRKALPGLNDVSFEGEESQVDYSKSEPIPDQMPDKDILAWTNSLKEAGYTTAQLEESFLAIKGDKKPRGMTLDMKDAINTHLKDNCKPAGSK